MVKRKTTEQFIQESTAIHGDVYDYSLTNYINRRTKVKIICTVHGIYEQTAGNHLYQKQGCSKCAGDKQASRQRKSLSQFIQEATIVHDSLYDYSLVDYNHTDIKVKIICPTHDIFKQTPHDHLHGKGCPKCVHTISKGETNWLNRIGLPDDTQHRQVRLPMNNNKNRRVDGYDPLTNTVYEFHGDYWHGNPARFNLDDINPTIKKPYRQLYEATLTKEVLIKDSGYNLVVMWEHDWKAHPSLTV